ncbi:MAG: ATP-dependent Clp protease adapter ClpS [Cyanobacteria bacterium QS_8_64_29]|nr:MAG: ATP-dependent Clp protease adapter ClpS [Cyanobacteria bacterium QS_8_64_29]
MPAPLVENPGVQTVEKNETSRQLAPRYRVLLHNDDVNSMEHVVQALLQTVPSLSEPQAIDIMMEAHNSGLSLVIACDLEPAEFYCETLQSHGLTSTIEPEE